MADVEVQTNLAASVAPTVTDDASAGWSVFSPWVDIVANRVYFCADTALGAAVWRELIGGVSGAVLTLPRVNDTSEDNQYVFAVSELVADRTVTLPLLTGADTFVFEAHAQTLTNKTIVAADNSITLFASGANNQLLTDDGSGGLVSESGLTFDGTLNVTAPASTVGFNIDLNATPGNAITVTDSGSNILFAVDETGQVGVGTDSPLSTGGFAPLVQIEGDFPAFVLNSTRGGGRRYAFASNVSGGSGFFNIFDETAAIHRMVIDASGNFGVNTVTPQALFELRADAGASGTLQLSTAEATVVDGDELGRIDFRAPVDGAGGDAVLVAASIYAEAGATFSSSVNTTNLVFATGDSETATEKMRVDSVGNFGIGMTTVNEKLQVDDAIAISSDAEGSTARLTRRTRHETHTLAAAATSDTTTISIPSGARLLAVSFNVNTAVVDDGGDDTWSAAFVTGSTTTLATAAAAAQNTKVNLMLPDEISTGICQIRFTAQGGSFSAGVIETVAYFESLTSLANA